MGSPASIVAQHFLKTAVWGLLIFITCRALRIFPDRLCRHIYWILCWNCLWLQWKRSCLFCNRNHSAAVLSAQSSRAVRSPECFRLAVPRGTRRSTSHRLSSCCWVLFRQR